MINWIFKALHPPDKFRAKPAARYDFRKFHSSHFLKYAEVKFKK
jgi:hypothetical protein